jgi:hypothetical protein
MTDGCLPLSALTLGLTFSVLTLGLTFSALVLGSQPPGGAAKAEYVFECDHCQPIVSCVEEHKKQAFASMGDAATLLENAKVVI